MDKYSANEIHLRSLIVVVVLVVFKTVGRPPEGAYYGLGRSYIYNRKGAPLDNYANENQGNVRVWHYNVKKRYKKIII